MQQISPAIYDMPIQYDINLETFTCPITLQVLRDPVIAKDGHAYERKAIVKWIRMYGTSPLTRQPLNIDDLHVDENLRCLAAQRRSSTASNITQDSSVSFPATFELDSSSMQSPQTTVRNETIHLKVCFLWQYRVFMWTIIFIISMMIGVIVGILRSQITTDTHSTSGISGCKVFLPGKFSFDSGTYQCANCSASNHYYEAYKATMRKNGYIFVTIRSVVSIYAHVYINAFSQQNPLLNQISFVNNGSTEYLLAFSIYLTNNIDYIIVITTRHEFMRGIFTITVLGPCSIDLIHMKNTGEGTTTNIITTTERADMCVANDSLHGEYVLAEGVTMDKCIAVCNDYLDLVDPQALVFGCWLVTGNGDRIRVEPGRNLTTSVKKIYGDCITQDTIRGLAVNTNITKEQCQHECDTFFNTAYSRASVYDCQFIFLDHSESVLKKGRDPLQY